MHLFQRNCPNCKVAIPIAKRIGLIRHSILKCNGCSSILQPTILWGIVTSILLAPIIYFLIYPSFKTIVGNNIATAIVFISIYIVNRLLEPFSDLKAHDENEFL